VGIPARSADCKHIFDAFVAGKLEDPKTCQQVMEKYNCKLLRKATVTLI
jgi:hypothetical protein